MGNRYQDDGTDKLRKLVVPRIMEQSGILRIMELIG